MKPLVVSLILFIIPTFTVAQNTDAGRVLFENHCATCHGNDAQGAGPMSQVLMIPPSDLTQLSAKAGGTFPISYLVAKVDGRVPLLSHGSPMPLFGPFFEGKGVAMRGDDGILIMTSQPIIDLVTYLETLQE
ncbi:mono/diheme cytochrome c family protein [Yoonia maricola]|uniref:Mono/diheme cytochrome c family protein n=1 Tax=Yoonia maricola TaxID=420999 RepID=A0A2M8W061_9RHOB|nr:cytochrome c [Yoonia maricola]PJI84311.1 mono/diheme cytochrome c family protein [Yoonia maricola]